MEKSVREMFKEMSIEREEASRRLDAAFDRYAKSIVRVRTVLLEYETQLDQIADSVDESVSEECGIEDLHDTADLLELLMEDELQSSESGNIKPFEVCKIEECFVQQQIVVDEKVELIQILPISTMEGQGYSEEVVNPESEELSNSEDLYDTRDSSPKSEVFAVVTNGKASDFYADGKGVDKSAIKGADKSAIPADFSSSPSDWSAAGNNVNATSIPVIHSSDSVRSEKLRADRFLSDGAVANPPLLHYGLCSSLQSGIINVSGLNSQHYTVNNDKKGDKILYRLQSAGNDTPSKVFDELPGSLEVALCTTVPSGSLEVDLCTTIPSENEKKLSKTLDNKVLETLRGLGNRADAISLEVVSLEVEKQDDDHHKIEMVKTLPLDVGLIESLNFDVNLVDNGKWLCKDSRPEILVTRTAITSMMENNLVQTSEYGDRLSGLVPVKELKKYIGWCPLMLMADFIRNNILNLCVESGVVQIGDNNTGVEALQFFQSVGNTTEAAEAVVMVLLGVIKRNKSLNFPQFFLSS